MPSCRVPATCCTKDKTWRYVDQALEARSIREILLSGVNSVVLYYTNQKGTRSGEFMGFSEIEKVARVVTHYSAQHILIACVSEEILDLVQGDL